MENLATPDSVIDELVHVRREAQKGVDALYSAEIKLANATLLANKVEASALFSAEGNVAERQAQAAIESADAKFDEFVARAEWNRVKTKIRLLEQAQTNIQTQARMVELMWKSAGVGEK